MVLKTYALIQSSNIYKTLTISKKKSLRLMKIYLHRFWIRKYNKVNIFQMVAYLTYSNNS